MSSSSINLLPPKELALFKKILRCYEQKQYKSGLKFAKQILSNPKFSEHGETLAMKGLSLNYLGKKEEAYENVKKGLKNDLTSYVCWHAYGLLQRSDYKYDEAIKCYRNALKWNQSNIQIWRDLSALQIQMRDLEGFRESRFQLFKLRATQRTSWVGFSISCHLLKDYKMATSILGEFLNQNVTNSDNKPDNKPDNKSDNKTVHKYEYSELVLYQICVLMEGCFYEEALDFLIKNRHQICDKVSLYEYQANLMIKLNKKKEALNIIKKKLLNRNPEYKLYYQYLEMAQNVQDDENERYKIYLEYQKIFPLAYLPFRIPLDFITNLNQFKIIVDNYIKKSLRKCQPALFKDLKCLYQKDNKKMEIIQNLMHSYYENLKKYSSFDDIEDNRGSEDIVIFVWVNFYLSQHYNFLKNFKLAMAHIDEAILHTPTLVELYVIKGKIYKDNFKINEAVECLKEAQSLDQADRYLNTKYVKYLLRHNLIKEAEVMSGKFTREGLDASEDLNQMQCMWYQNEVAHAYYRLGNYGEALKKCHEINRHFDEMKEDQFDFHSYCIRKVTLRSYVDLLRLEDVLKDHPFFFNAAKLAIKIYLKLHDFPLKEENIQPIETNYINLKKTKKCKKNKQNGTLEHSDKENGQKTKDASSKDKNYTMASTLHTEPLIPKELERCKNALEEAEKFLKPILMFAKDKIDTYILAFDFYYRKDKMMLMLQSLKRAFRIDSQNKIMIQKLNLFIDVVNQKSNNLNENLRKVIDIELNKLQNGCLNNLNDKLEQIHL